MELSDILSNLISIVITYYFTKWSERRKKICNFTKNEFSIGISLREEFPNLDLKYKNETVNNDLRIYKGILMNTGHKDISANGNKNTINVIFPEGCLIRDVKIKKGKVDVEVFIDQNSDNFYLNFGLIQENECFEYDVIYEDSKNSSKKIADMVKFKYRIEDVSKKIDNKPLPQLNTEGLYTNFFKFQLAVVVASFIVMFLLYDFWSLNLIDVMPIIVGDVIWVVLMLFSCSKYKHDKKILKMIEESLGKNWSV